MSMAPLKLKLKVPGTNPDGSARAPSIVSTGTPATPAPQSAVTPGGSKAPKLIFKNPNSQPATPAPAPAPVEDAKPKKTKAGRSTKPSAKLIESKKRTKEESESENEASTIAVKAPEHASKKLKLIARGHSFAQTPGLKTPVVLKAKVKGAPPKRPIGQGYDSEASDREEDPYIEEEFVLRMMPGEDCEYLRTAIAEKKIGLPKNQGGPDIHMKFYHHDGRRASIMIRGHCYAATLVDLPSVIEGMKSWDKRGWWKSADICQMLWVFSSIEKEEDAKTIPLPKIINEETYQYPHGLTPPMHFARKRRFRKRISRTAIEKVEQAVERLLEADAKAHSTRFEMIDPDRGTEALSPGDSHFEGPYSEDEDAEGEADDTGYFNTQHTNEAQPMPFDEEVDEDDLQDMFDAEMSNSLVAETPSSAVGATPSIPNGGDTPMIEQAVEEEEEEDDSGDESLEDDDDDENAIADDEAERARLEKIQGIKEDIADMEKAIEESNRQLALQPNKIIRGRLEAKIRSMKAELQLKISALDEGEGVEDD